MESLHPVEMSFGDWAHRGPSSQGARNRGDKHGNYQGSEIQGSGVGPLSECRLDSRH